MKWLAKVWRSPWLACPRGRSIVVLAKARRNEVMALQHWPCRFQCSIRKACSSGDIGTDRTFPLFVPLKVTTPSRKDVGLRFSASDQRAPVAKQIKTTGSTCGLSQPERIDSSSSASHQCTVWPRRAFRIRSNRGLGRCASPAVVFKIQRADDRLSRD